MQQNIYDFIALLDVNSTIALDIRYAKTTNFTGKIIYPQEGCYARMPVAHALDAAQKELALSGLGLKIFDAYRPLRYQQLFWDIMPDERYVADPQKGSKHNRGAAIDLTLIRLADGTELEMPSDFDDLSARAHRNYAAMRAEAAKNCKILEAIMEKHGFAGWPEEWWHFDFHDWERYPLADISFDELQAAHARLM